MKKLTRKITLSLVAILFAVIALGTTTYAWFTLGTTATVSSIDGQVKAAEGIEVSLDSDASKRQWSNVIKFNDTTKLSYNNREINRSNVLLQDLALTNDKTNGLVFNGVDEQPTEANSAYLAFDLFVRVNGDFTEKNKDIQITNLDIISTPFNFTADVDTDAWSKGTGYTLNASNAARVSFSKLTKDDTATTYTEEYKVTYAKESVATSKEETNFNGGNDSQNGLAKQYVVAKGFDTKNLFTNYNNYDHAITNVTDATSLHSYSTKVVDDVTIYRVYIWLSGFDGDCVNAILGKKITVSFNLVLADK